MSTGNPPLEPFRVPTPPPAPPGLGPGPVGRSLRRVAAPVIERALALPTLNDIYAQIQNRTDDDRHFADKALDALHVRYRAAAGELARIPTTGPLVVVANHPFGGVEGMILCSLLRRVRPDVKLLANYMLSVIPDLRDSFFFVDPFDTPESKRRNLASMRSAIDWVKGGGCLGVFPAGEVSHLKVRQRSVSDPPWSRTVGKIVQRTGSAVVPVFFDGRNSAWFQIAGMIHPKLRTAMLPREMLKKRRGRVRLRIGGVIPPPRLASMGDAEALTRYLRVRTYVLRPTLRWRRRPDSRAVAGTHAEPVVDPVPREDLIDELAALPASARLHGTDTMDVLIARREQFPAVVREIGRLREVAFRQVGEGTGKAIDLDRFDDTYLHLIVWDRGKHQIVGAYRLGPTDTIMADQGVEGLYTATLFRFKRRLLEQIDPALELGRSFVHPDYQRSFAPLMLLWSGIARYLAIHPQYRHLFGTVSISADYSSMTKQLLMSFLKNHRAVPGSDTLLKARNPPRPRKHPRPPHDWHAAEFSTVARDIGSVNELIADLEADGKHMPILLRQYLKLNGKLLGFNIDPDFGNVLDGLMLFDVTEIPALMLNKYMGKANRTRYLACHGIEA